MRYPKDVPTIEELEQTVAAAREARRAQGERFRSQYPWSATKSAEQDLSDFKQFLTECSEVDAYTALKRAESRLDYYKHHSARDASHKAYNAEHVEENAAYHQEWRAANYERVSAQEAAYREANRDRCRLAVHNWYVKHAEEQRTKSRLWHEHNREYHLAMNAAWYRANPVKAQQYNHQRRARLAGTDSCFTAVDYEVLMLIQDSCCAYCGRPAGWGSTVAQLAPEHMIPLSRGGADIFENVVLACHGIGSCNSSKGDKTLDEYIEYLKTTQGADIALQVQSRVLEVLELKLQFTNELDSTGPNWGEQTTFKEAKK